MVRVDHLRPQVLSSLLRARSMADGVLLSVRALLIDSHEPGAVPTLVLPRSQNSTLQLLTTAASASPFAHSESALWVANPRYH